MRGEGQKGDEGKGKERMTKEGKRKRSGHVWDLLSVRRDIGQRREVYRVEK